jgi:hypothetical protein
VNATYDLHNKSVSGELMPQANNGGMAVVI